MLPLHAECQQSAKKGRNNIMNSRAIGCRKLHFSKRTKASGGAITYAAPKPIPGLESVDYSFEIKSAVGHSDDTVDTNISKVSSVKVEITLAYISTALKAELEGHKYEKGKVIINKDDTAPEIALLWQETKGDGNATNRILYRGILSVNGMSNKTNGDNIEFDRVQLSGVFVPDENGFVMDEIDGDAADVDKVAFGKFFTVAPVAPSPSTVPGA